MKFGVETIFGMRNVIVAFMFEIDIFFIKYSRSDDKLAKTYNETLHNNEIRCGDYPWDGQLNFSIYYWN